VIIMAMSEKKPSRKGKTWGIAVLLLLLGAGAYFGTSKYRGGSPVTYTKMEVTRGDITQIVTATGTLNPVVNVQVGSQISGNIQKLFVDFNSPVKAGQVVAQIDPATFQATVLQAEGELASAKAGLELAELNAKRTEELRARNAAPQATLDQAVASLHQAQAALKVREGSLARAKVDLNRCTIVSPIDGIVISRSVDVGQTVAASLQAPVIFTIANDLAKMQIDSNVAEADVGVVELGQSVEFTVDAFPTRVFHGKVVQVRNAPITVQNVVSYDTVISVSNDDLKLKPGMTANASIIVASRKDVLKLPGAALRFRMPEPTSAGPAAAAARQPGVSGVSGGTGGGGGGGGRPAGGRSSSGRREGRVARSVFVLRDGKPEPVQIKTGISDGIFTEVQEGLAEGDQVVTGMQGGAATPAPASSPFGGSGFRRM
jgi:HlyD family secretion protein